MLFNCCIAKQDRTGSGAGKASQHQAVQYVQHASRGKSYLGHIVKKGCYLNFYIDKVMQYLWVRRSDKNWKYVGHGMCKAVGALFIQRNKTFRQKSSSPPL